MKHFDDTPITADRFYITETTANGFKFCGAGSMRLAIALVRLGERLANEGKKIVDVCFEQRYSYERNQYEGVIDCKIQFKLKDRATLAEKEKL